MNPTDNTDPILLVKWHDIANWLLDRVDGSNIPADSRVLTEELLEQMPVYELEGRTPCDRAGSLRPSMNGEPGARLYPSAQRFPRRLRENVLYTERNVSFTAFR